MFELLQAEQPLHDISFGLTAAPHHGNIPSALQPRPITAIFLRPYSSAPSRQYSFGLTAAPYHGDIPSALQPCPITAILLWPYSRAPSQRYSFGLTAAPHHGDIPLALQPCSIHGDIFFGLAATPHGDINFLFASRRLLIFLCLLARIDFIPPYGDSRLTAISIFSLPHGKNQFHST